MSRLALLLGLCLGTGCATTKPSIPVVHFSVPFDAPPPSPKRQWGKTLEEWNAYFDDAVAHYVREAAEVGAMAHMDASTRGLDCEMRRLSFAMNTVRNLQADVNALYAAVAANIAVHQYLSGARTRDADNELRRYWQALSAVGEAHEAFVRAHEAFMACAVIVDSSTPEPAMSFVADPEDPLF